MGKENRSTYQLDRCSPMLVALSAIILTLFLLLLHSCTLYPRYKRPCAEMPDQWRIASDETSTAVNIRWWQQFQDPVLDELIQEALENNKDLWIATARIAEFRARVGIASSQLWPQIAGQASFSRQRISQPAASVPFFPANPANLGNNGNENGDIGNNNVALAGILPDFGQVSPFSNDYLAIFSGSYDLDLWGRIRSSTNAAFAELLGEVDARRSLILSIVSSVATAYMKLRQYDRQLKISMDTYASRQQSYELAVIRFEEGLTSELEVKQAAAERDEASIQVIEFQTRIPQQENLISVLIGHPPTSIHRGDSVDGWTLPPEVPTGLPSDLLEQRPDILEAEQKLRAANFRIGEARALYFPDITLTGYYGYESSILHDWFTNPSKVWQWMANLLQPLFTGGQITSTVDLTKAQAREAVYHYLQVILNALREVNDALIGHENAKKSLNAQLERVHDLKGYLHLATLQYENGLVDYLNVLDAQRLLFNAQLDLTATQADVFISLVNLYKALGGGWVIDAENSMKTGCSTCAP